MIVIAGCLAMLSQQFRVERGALVARVLLISTMPFTALPFEAAEKTPLQPADLFAIHAGYDPQVSPDGMHVVYVQVRADVMQDEYQSTLWIVDADGHNHHPLTDAKDAASDPRWSPDGRRIAFLASRNGAREIVVRWMDNGVETQIGGFSAPPSDVEWSPDGKMLAFTMLESIAARSIGAAVRAPPGASWKPGPIVIDRARYRSDGKGYLPRGQMHIFVVPADGGAFRRITSADSGELPPVGRPFDWTPDGRALVAALVHRTEAEILKGRMFDTGLYLLPIDGEPMEKLIDRDGPESWPAVSPDGRYIAYAGYDEAQRSYTVAQLFVFDRRTHERRAITTRLDRDVLAPRWAPNGQGIYAYFADHGVNRLVLFDMHGAYHVITDNLATPLTAYTAQPNFTVARDGSVAMEWATATSTGEIALARSDGKTVRRLTTLNDSLFDARALAQVEEINYRSSKDGVPIQGWFLHPPAFDLARQYPLILEIHGGPDACYGPRFDPEKQVMAGAGFLVLYVNPRGSSGYGAEFGNLIQDDYPDYELEDLMSGVDAMLARGGVDPHRLYVTGGSGGGTLTGWLISHTTRFRAAAVLYPVIDWQSEALTSDILSLVFHGFFHGTPWTQPEMYRKHSLLALADQVHTPTLVMTGEADYRTPISESEQYFAALKYHGVDSVFVRMPQENHGIRAFPSHFAAKLPIITGWFEEHP